MQAGQYRLHPGSLTIAQSSSVQLPERARTRKQRPMVRRTWLQAHACNLEQKAQQWRGGAGVWAGS